MKKFKLILIVAILLLVTSCNEIGSGTIIEKTFIPAHDRTYDIVHYINVGEMSVPYRQERTTHYPDTWTILIQKYDKSKLKMLESTFEVEESFYNTAEIGDYYVNDEFEKANEVSEKVKVQREKLINISSVIYLVVLTIYCIIRIIKKKFPNTED